MITIRSLAIAAAATLAFTAGRAHAATATTTFNVRITITAACDISTTAPTDVNFGSQPSTATNVDNQGALNVNCTATGQVISTSPSRTQWTSSFILETEQQ